MSGPFVTLEGGEGSGKSTVAREMADRLRRAGREVVLAQEPRGTDLGRYIWAFFQGERAAVVSPLAELLLFEAARAQHVGEVIRPALAAGHAVVCDRFSDSSVAYQGYGRGLGHEFVEALNEAATGGLHPDVTILLDIAPEDGLARARSEHAAGKETDAIGEESLAFHQCVRKGFLAIAERDPARIRIVDAGNPLDTVNNETWQCIAGVLERQT